jgi:hypothetical protein
MYIPVRCGYYIDWHALPKGDPEMDFLYGIYESRKRFLRFSVDKTFEYTYEYFYESEDGSYNI